MVGTNRTKEPAIPKLCQAVALCGDFRRLLLFATVLIAGNAPMWGKTGHPEERERGRVGWSPPQSMRGTKRSQFRGGELRFLRRRGRKHLEGRPRPPVTPNALQRKSAGED